METQEREMLTNTSKEKGDTGADERERERERD
jgi:hypothetical protein